MLKIRTAKARMRERAEGTKPLSMKKLIGLLCIVILKFTSCFHEVQSPSTIIKTYQDIPGITQEEIDAIETIKQEVIARGRPLIVGTTHNTESFIAVDGMIGGFIPMMSQWLTDLFDIPFVTEVYDLNDMLSGMLTGEVDFGINAYTPERLQEYYLAEPFINRTLKIMRRRDSIPPHEIERRRRVRYAFLQNATQYTIVSELLPPGSFEPVFAENYDALYHVLLNGEADAMIVYNTSEASFDKYGDIIVEDFLPLMFIPLSLSAGLSELEPVLSVVTKALNHGAYIELTEMYREGNQRYRRNKFLALLNEEEISFIRENPVIQFASQYLSYPISFYNPVEKKWEGIAFDIVNEIALLSGLEFEINHPPSLTSVECLELMKSGKVYFMPYLIRSSDRLREDSIYANILWSENSYMSDQYALLSKQNFPNIKLNDIPFARVGYPARTAFAEMFQTWFPDALYAVEYPNTDEAFAAVERGETDMVMINRGRLAAMTNYYELSDYKANFVFDAPFYIHFGFNEEQTVLRSIVDKALPLINSDIIADQWMSMTYNFEAMRLREQRPWLIAAIVLSFVAFALTLAMLVNNHNKRKIISKQAAELASLLEETKRVSDYELMKHVLTIKAMNFSLWDFNIPPEAVNNEALFPHDTPYTWSQEFRHLLGFTDEHDFPNKLQSWSDLLHPEDMEKTLKAILAHIRDFSGNTPYDVEYRLKTKSGEYRYFHAIGNTQRDNSGFPLRFVGGMEDIHEKKLMSEALAQREKMLTEQSIQLAVAKKESEDDQRLKLMLDSAPIGIIFFDVDFNLIDCNKTVMDMFGISDKDKLLESFYDLSPEHQPNGQLTKDVMTDIQKKIHSEKIIQFEWLHEKPDGGQLLCEVFFLSSEYKGEPITISYMRDLSKEKEAEELAQMMLDAAPFGAVLWDSTLKILNTNKELVRYFDLSNKQEFIDNFDKMAPEYQPNGERSQDISIAALKKAFDEGYYYTEFEHINLKGVKIPCEITLVRLKYRGEYLVIAYSRDLRKEKKMLAEIESERIAAEAANRAKTVFLANMSHEIRTPMNSIIGFSELAQAADLPAKTKSYLDKILQSARLLLSVINDILDVSKIESGKMELERVPFNLQEIFAYCRSAILPKAQEKGLLLHCYTEPSLGKILIGDPVRLRQVLLNMLSNAVKFTNSGTVKLIAYVKGFTDKSMTVCFEVKDSGIGISADQLSKIFDPFTQADSSITRKYGGTGLGLTITKNIIELMGGKLNVDSALDIGSKFSFELTFDTVDRITDSEHHKKKLSNPEKTSVYIEGDVLVCEDNEMNQMVICDHLERMGLKAVLAQNGKEGVEIVEKRMLEGKKPFDLIFMDIQMPVMDGLEAASKILELGSKTPMVALTANIMTGEMERYIDSGMYDFLGKPFSSHELKQILFKYLPHKFSPLMDDTHA